MKRLIVTCIIAGLLIAATTSEVLANYVDMVNSHNPVSYWRLDETSGSIAYDEKDTQDGTYNNVLLGQEGALSLECNNNSAVCFGGNGYVEILHNDAFLLDSGTVQLWFKDTGSINTAGLFSKDSSGFDDGGHLTIYTSDDNDDDIGEVMVRLQSTENSYYVLSSESIGLNIWYMVTFTFGDAGMKLYVNDGLVDDDTYTGGLGDNSEPIALGAATWISGDSSIEQLSDFFSGCMDEVVLYNKVLSPQEIADLYEMATTCIPEPATILLLGLGGMLLRKRKG